MTARFFIVGSGRSGTTLLRSMLNQHPQLAVPLEARCLIDYLRAAHLPVERIKRYIITEYELGEWGIDLTEQALADCDSLAAIVDRVHELYAHAHGKTRWGHKTPRFVRYGELVWRTYPDAKFIHVVRDPRAVVSSMIRSNAHRSNALYASRRWLRDVGCGRELWRKRPDQAMELTYEELVRHPRTTLQTVCRFLELPYDPQMLAYHDQAPAEYGAYYAKIHAALHRRPDPARIDAWRNELPLRQIAVVQFLCGPQMTEYGYALSAEPPPRWTYMQCLKAQRLLGFARQVGHTLRFRRTYLAGFVRRKFRLSLYRDLIAINE